MTSQHTITTTIPAIPAVLSVIEGSVTLDESWSPYVQAGLRIHTPEDETLLDPRDNVRVTVELERDGVPRTFDLALLSREIDHETGTTTLELSSDELLLQNYGLVTTTPERTYGVSVKTAVEYALTKIGATLQPGAADASLELSYTNLLINPSAATNVANWTAATNSTLAHSTSQGFIGGTSAAFTAVAAGDIAGWANSTSPYISITPNIIFTASIYLRGSVPREGAISLRYYTATGVNLGDTTSPRVTVPTDGWVRIGISATAPPTAAFAGVIVRGYGFAASNVLFADGAMLTDGANAVPYGEGPTSDATIWTPGVSAWDFVAPLVEAGGLRFYCDEQRRWHLRETGEITDGLLTIAEGFNLTRGTDRVSLSDRDSFYTGVVIAYRDTDGAGLPRVTYDVAGTPDNVLSLSFDRTYPGAGAAAQELLRASGKGRVYSLRAISQYTATPGMSVSATLPGVIPQVGVVSAVTWNFPAAEMDVSSRGLIETPPSAWIFDTPGVSWADVPPGTDWTEDI